MQSVLIMQTYYAETFVGLLETDGYSNGVPNWGSYLVLQKSPL